MSGCPNQCCPNVIIELTDTNMHISIYTIFSLYVCSYFIASNTF